MSAAEIQECSLTPAELDAAITEWALVEQIVELEVELAEARKTARGPVPGGPPAAWDAWVLALPDEVFADCLGPKDGESPKTVRRERRQRSSWLERNAAQTGTYAQ